MKYKLIKIYPGSPALGTIVENRHGAIYCVKTTFIWSSSEIDYFDKMVTNQPEFWELIIEKDFEILEFTSKNSGDKAIRNIKGSFNTSNIYNLSEKELLADNRSIITKVKRLSDNEIFTIGDYVKVNITITQDTIKEFNVLLNNLCVSLNHQFDSSFYGKKGCNITVINKIKPVLFITEDGVDIFETTAVHWVVVTNKSSNKNVPYYLYELKFCKAHLKLDLKNEYKLFSTKEKAEEYILINKPCLSINDIQILKNIVFKDWDSYLKQKVKSKL